VGECYLSIVLQKAHSRRELILLFHRLNALILGRLRMSTKEALEIYPAFAKKVFGNPKSKLRAVIPGGRFTFYSATAMESEIKKIVVNKLRHDDPQATGEELMLDHNPEACKT
jgi:hypothetical protein